MRHISPELVSDRMRLALALVRCGYTPSAAATKAAVSEAELNFFQDVDNNGFLPRDPLPAKQLH